MSDPSTGEMLRARLAARVSLWNRTRKMRLFLATMRPGPETTVVDVGAGDTGFLTEEGVASTHNFFEAMYPWPGRVTAVSDVPLPTFAAVFPMVRCVVADGRDLPFEDDAFDISFSNAVVEHVGCEVDQRQFVHELCRVARRVFLSTPNRRFPIETHSLLPFVHWLPAPARNVVFRRLRQERWTDLNLLTRERLVALFPEDANVQVLESRITITAAASRLSSAS